MRDGLLRVRHHLDGQDLQPLRARYCQSRYAHQVRAQALRGCYKLFHGRYKQGRCMGDEHLQQPLRISSSRYAHHAAVTAIFRGALQGAVRSPHRDRCGACSPHRIHGGQGLASIASTMTRATAHHTHTHNIHARTPLHTRIYGIAAYTRAHPAFEGSTHGGHVTRDERAAAGGGAPCRSTPWTSPPPSPPCTTLPLPSHPSPALPPAPHRRTRLPHACQQPSHAPASIAAPATASASHSNPRCMLLTASTCSPHARHSVAPWQAAD